MPEIASRKNLSSLIKEVGNPRGLHRGGARNRVVKIGLTSRCRQKKNGATGSGDWKARVVQRGWGRQQAAQRVTG